MPGGKYKMCFQALSITRLVSTCAAAFENGIQHTIHLYTTENIRTTRPSLQMVPLMLIQAGRSIADASHTRSCLWLSMRLFQAIGCSLFVVTLGIASTSSCFDWQARRCSRWPQLLRVLCKVCQQAACPIVAVPRVWISCHLCKLPTGG
jgi:hypothetical protein